MSLPSGHKIGSYQIVSLLGAGGMGEVYRARDSKLGRVVALKVLPARLASDAEYMARFHREAHMLASLNHPNIATIHGLEANAIVMELVEGETLAERIKRGALPLEEALPIAHQIVNALEAAHEKGVIHRDIKPANIKVTPDGTVKGGQWPAYVIPASGGSPRKLGESGGRLRGWSKVGRHLLVWRVAEPANTLGVLDTANGTYTTILSSAKSRLSEGRLSPDGKWVAFVSGNPGGEATAHIAPFRGAQSVPESEWIPIADGGGYVFWAPDSHSLYFRRGGAFHRQPLDAAARPAGPAEEFYRLDTFRLASPVTNTVVASRDRIFFISFEGRSDIWMTELR